MGDVRSRSIGRSKQHRAITGAATKVVQVLSRCEFRRASGLTRMGSWADGVAACCRCTMGLIVRGPWRTKGDSGLLVRAGCFAPERKPFRPVAPVGSPPLNESLRAPWGTPLVKSRYL